MALKLSSRNLFRSADILQNQSQKNKKSVSNIGKTLQRQSVFKRQSIAKRKNLYAQRATAIRRKNQQDFLDASRSTGSRRSVSQIVRGSNKGFFGRILEAVSFAMVGWAVQNLPRIVTMANKLGQQIPKLTVILSSFMNNTFSIFKEIGALSSGLVRSLLAFDFNSMGRQVQTSLINLSIQFGRLEDDLYDGIKIFSDLFKLDEKYKPPGGQQPPGGNPPGQQPGPGGGGNRATAGTKEQRAALDAISFAEGTTGKNGYSTWAGYQKHGPDDLTGLTIRQVHDLQTTFITSGKVKKTGSAVVGRYQFLTPYNQAKEAGLNPETDKFSPENQDKMAIYIMNKVGATDAVLKKEGISSRVSTMLGSQWAPFPGSPFGQSTKPLSSIQKAYQKSLGTPTPPPAPPTPGPNVPFAIPSLDRSLRYQPGSVLTGTIGRGVPYVEIRDVVGAPRGGGRTHQGIDIFAPTGTYIALRLTGKVLYAGWQVPSDHNVGYGLLVDIWIPELGVQLRFGHCSELLCSTGDTIKAGNSFARVGYTGNANPKNDSGAHIHFEYTTQYNNSNYGTMSDPSPYIPFLILSAQRLSAKPAKGGTTNQRTPAQISPTGTAQNIPENITPTNEGETIYVTVPQQAYQNPGMSAGAGGGGSIIIGGGDSLNSLIKQRILLELSYT